MKKPIKLERQRIYKKYMQWVDKVTRACEWKSTFEPEEIVGAICNIIEEELNGKKQNLYCYRHKPTQTWVKFQKNQIVLSDKKAKASLGSKKTLKEKLLKGSLHKSKTYGKHNFLEFQIEKVNQPY